MRAGDVLLPPLTAVETGFVSVTIVGFTVVVATPDGLVPELPDVPEEPSVPLEPLVPLDPLLPELPDEPL